MRGQYSHNTGVWTNRGSSGGWQAYRNNGNEKDNMATRLDAAGYRTGLFGKYLNEYPGAKDEPPGWDRWFAHTEAPLLRLQDQRRWQNHPLRLDLCRL